MDRKYFAISIDDFVNAAFDLLKYDECIGAHYCGFMGITQNEARNEILRLVGAWLDENMYESDSYGTPKEDV